MVRYNCFIFSIGASMVFGFETKSFRAHDAKKNSSEAIPCPADTPNGSLVGRQPKSLTSLLYEFSLRRRLGRSLKCS